MWLLTTTMHLVDVRSPLQMTDFIGRLGGVSDVTVADMLAYVVVLGDYDILTALYANVNDDQKKMVTGILRRDGYIDWVDELRKVETLKADIRKHIHGEGTTVESPVPHMDGNDDSDSDSSSDSDSDSDSSSSSDSEVVVNVPEL